MNSTSEDFNEVLSKSKKILERYALCDSCLGRLFANLGYGLSNADRGRAIKTLLLLKAYNSLHGITDENLAKNLARTGFKPALTLLQAKEISVKIDACHLCRGLMERIEEIAEKTINALKDYEFDTFLVGATVPQHLAEEEEEIWRQYKINTGEMIKSELTREIGKQIEKQMHKKYDPQKPDITIIIYIGDTGEVSIHVNPSPIFIYGKYQKLKRGIPQTPFKDDNTQISIQTLIADPIVRAAEARGAKFHAAGREDVDVLTLGSGRPFIVEVQGPRKRTLNLKEIEEEINKNARGIIKVHGLKYVSRSMVAKIKALAEFAKKTYKATVEFEEEVTDEDAKKIEENFRNIEIKQRTPIRVLHRRVDKVRTKIVYWIKAEKTGPQRLTLTIKCQGGLYVKELIHGDQGRTKPNISELIGKKVKRIILDVVDIEEKT